MPSPSEADALLTTQEVADALRVSTATVLRRHEAGDLPAIVLGPRTLRWREADIKALIGSDPAPAPVKEGGDKP